MKPKKKRVVFRFEAPKAVAVPKPEWHKGYFPVGLLNSDTGVRTIIFIPLP